MSKWLMWNDDTHRYFTKGKLYRIIEKRAGGRDHRDTIEIVKPNSQGYQEWEIDQLVKYYDPKHFTIFNDHPQQLRKDLKNIKI